jgi:hypothetical protein
MQFSPFSSHLIPLRSKYPPQHPVLKHPVYVPPLMSETKFSFLILKKIFFLKYIEFYYRKYMFNCSISCDYKATSLGLNISEV